MFKPLLSEFKSFMKGPISLSSCIYPFILNQLKVFQMTYFTSFLLIEQNLILTLLLLEINEELTFYLKFLFFLNAMGCSIACLHSEDNLDQTEYQSPKYFAFPNSLKHIQVLNKRCLGTKHECADITLTFSNLHEHINLLEHTYFLQPVVQLVSYTLKSLNFLLLKGSTSC